MILRLTACLIAGVLTFADSTAVGAEEEEDAETNTEQAVEATAEEPLPEDVDWSALAPTLTLPSAPPAPRRSAPRDMPAAAWSRDVRANGVAAVSVKRPLSELWDMKAGADLEVAKQPSPVLTPETLAERLGGKPPTSHGTAWVSAKAPGVPYLADHVTLEARMDPTRDARLGTVFSKTLPLSGEHYALTLRQGFAVIQHDAIPGLPGGASAGRSYDMDRSAQFSINDTGTSLIAGQSLAPNGDWLNSVSAEQKLFGGLSITGSVSETADGAGSGSLTAGFKKSW